jgi:hypothetical protein
MSKFLAATLLSLVAAGASAADLTATETRWLTAGSPVLAYAKELKLPIDIIVQPQAGPNDVPMAMGFADGRCKLVLSMRGNPNAESVFQGVPEAEQGVLIEAMTAHEVAHCWRYAQGSWHALPSGFVEVGQEQSDSPELLALSRQMRETRREEAYSDLAALAWTQRNHPGEYARVHRWLESVRADQPSNGSHDTRAWLKLANGGAQFARGPNLFDQVKVLWSEGLLQSE